MKQIIQPIYQYLYINKSKVNLNILGGYFLNLVFL